MNISKAFTDALVREQMISEGLEQGYNDRDDYLNKDSSWAALRNGMLPEHEKQYGGGSGGELSEKNGSPPKMAAFASSSRMIYTLSAVKKKIEGFRFEKKLSTTVGGQANLDDYFNRGGYLYLCGSQMSRAVRSSCKAENFASIRRSIHIFAGEDA